MLLALLLSAPPVIPYVAEPPVVDGLRDDSAWAEALVLHDLRVIEPNVGADPTEPSYQAGSSKACFRRTSGPKPARR